MSPLFAAFIAAALVLGFPVLSAAAFVPLLRVPGGLLARIEEANRSPWDADTVSRWALLLQAAIFLFVYLILGLFCAGVVLDEGDPLVRAIFAVAFGFWIGWTIYLMVVVARSLAGGSATPDSGS